MSVASSKAAASVAPALRDGCPSAPPLATLRNKLGSSSRSPLQIAPALLSAGSLASSTVKVENANLVVWHRRLDSCLRVDKLHCNSSKPPKAPAKRWHRRTALILAENDLDSLLDFARKGDFAAAPSIRTSGPSSVWLLRSGSHLARKAAASVDDSAQLEHSARKGDWLKHRSAFQTQGADILVAKRVVRAFATPDSAVSPNGEAAASEQSAVTENGHGGPDWISFYSHASGGTLPLPVSGDEDSSGSPSILADRRESGASAASSGRGEVHFKTRPVNGVPTNGASVTPTGRVGDPSETLLPFAQALVTANGAATVAGPASNLTSDEPESVGPPFRTPAPDASSPSASPDPASDTLRPLEGEDNKVITSGGNESPELDVAIDSVSTEQKGRYWKGLIDTETRGALHLDGRAGSVADAHVLRRKGHLKEQDGLIEFMIDMHRTHTPYEVMAKMEKWLREHQQDHKRSTLRRLIPGIGRLHTSLKLVEALREYDEFASLSRRRYVPPNFAEVRHILNIAQLHSIAEHAALITFDADGTLYADGHHMKDDNKMIAHIINLMKFGVHVAIVTAAGYPGEAHKFEGRLAGLLAAFQSLGLTRRTLNMFHVMGGECNYLLRVNDDYRLEFVEDELWQLPEMLEWREEDIKELLDEAQGVLMGAAARLRLPVQVLRKHRSVGIIPKQVTIYEVLEELALTAQNQLEGAKLPFCAFNGGNDVFVDVGNKSLGLAALMQFFKTKPHETMHVGDRFTNTGNDGATRSRCSILWVANPEETAFFIKMLLKDMRLARMNPYLE